MPPDQTINHSTWKHRRQRRIQEFALYRCVAHSRPGCRQCFRDHVSNALGCEPFASVLDHVLGERPEWLIPNYARQMVERKRLRLIPYRRRDRAGFDGILPQVDTVRLTGLIYAALHGAIDLQLGGCASGSKGPGSIDATVGLIFPSAEKC